MVLFPLDDTWFYSESAWVCAKWLWNARDCVTGLHDRRRREYNPVTPVECVSRSFRTHPCALAFITHTFRIHGIEMALLPGNLIYFALHIFQIRNFLCCVEKSWWNTPFKETGLDDGVAGDAAAMLLPRYGAFDLGLAVSVPLPIVTGIFVLLWFQSRLT